MPHTTKIIDVKELTDETVSYCVRCCDEEQTDSWCTVNIANLSRDEVDKTLAEHAQRIVATHEAKVQWRKSHKNVGDAIMPLQPELVAPVV